VRITDRDIARWRLRSQRLVAPLAASAVAVVDGLVAVHAENPRQSAWAVAARTDSPSRGEVRAALEDGRLIRTHVLRPTWHYVRAEDLGWLLDLTGPRVRRLTAQQLRANHGLDGPRLRRATAAAVDALADRPNLTRGQIADALNERGFDTGGQLMTILLAHLELEGLVCSGRPRDDEHTYALLADRVPTSRRRERDEALGELALRYFTGHGPATERDLAYWATLTLTDVRRGLHLTADRLTSFEHDGRTFWHAPADPPRRRAPPQGHLLQILDELYRGYQDSRWVLDTAGIVPRTREIATGMAVVDAQLLAAMRLAVTPEGVRFDVIPYRMVGPGELRALQHAATRYGDYLGLPARLEVLESR
jgi:hypothetical protein